MSHVFVVAVLSFRDHTIVRGQEFGSGEAGRWEGAPIKPLAQRSRTTRVHNKYDMAVQGPCKVPRRGEEIKPKNEQLGGLELVCMAFEPLKFTAS